MPGRSQYPRTCLPAALLVLSTVPAWAQPSGPAKGTLIVDGGGATDAVRDRFVALAGGVAAKIVAFPTGASSVRFGEDNTVLDPDWSRDRQEWTRYQGHLEKWLGVERLTVLHTRDRAVADSEAFVTPIRAATGVFLGAGNAGRLAAAYLGTRTHNAAASSAARRERSSRAPSSCAGGRTSRC